MADDLKTMLAKVVQSHGKRKFFFAYGTGKRIDGNGDGHLIIAGKKPKKPEVQAECACQTFVEGLCWSSADGDIVFFEARSTKLGAVTIAKIALTAKRLTGRQFDFQVPSPEEESRAAALGEGEDAQPQGQAAPRDSPATASDAESSLEARWLKRHAALEPAYLAALKGQRGDGPKMRAVFAFAVEQAGASEYDRALRALDSLEQLLDVARPTDAQFQERLQGLVTRVAKSAARGAALAEMKLAITEAHALARKPDLVRAAVVLDRLEGLLEQAVKPSAAAEPPKDESAADNGFPKQWAAARSNLQAALDKVSDQLVEFAGALMESREPNLVWIAEEGLSQLLSSLRGTARTIDRATSKTPATVAAKARPAIASLRKQLQTARVRACDENQLGVTVTIHDTIGRALKRLEETLAGAG